jgi:hypothetical protein
MDVDVLALQEVEGVGTLRNFVRDYLDNAYRHIVLIEGNDPRLIDLALVSKVPLGPGDILAARPSQKRADKPSDLQSRPA